MTARVPYLGLLILAGLPLGARTAEPTQSKHPRPELRTDVDLVLVSVSVTDRRGAAITGLRSEDFTLWDDRLPQPIVSFHAQDAPCSVGVVLDTSGSMRETLRVAKDIVRAFLGTSNPEDDFFLLTVSSKPAVLSEVTDDESLAARLQSAGLGGSTALLDTVRVALERIRSARNPRRALLVVSDGMDNHSRTSKPELMSLALETDAQIYTIAVDQSPPSEKPFQRVEQRRGISLMDDLAEKTGGLSFAVRSGSAGTDAAAKTGRALRNQYVIAFQAARTPPSGKWHRIRVHVSVPDARISARNGYFAP